MTTIAAAAGVAPALAASRLFASGQSQTQLAPPSNVRLVTKRVLTLADLTWVGTFKSPNILGASGGTVAYPRFTLRRVGGVLKTLWLGAAFGNLGAPDILIQADYPGYDPALLSSPPCESNVRNFGNGFLSRCVMADGTPMSGIYVNGLHWDDHNQCVWIVFNNNYNVSGTPDPVLIRGDINDGAPDATAVTWSGPWRLSGTAPNTTSTANSHQTCYYVVSVPPAYGTAHLGGATIALGAHGSSGDASSSFNNTLWAPASTPTASTKSTPSGGADLASKCLIGGDLTSSHRGRRPGDYITEGCGGTGQGAQDPTSFTRGALTGYWGATDVSGSAIWLDWDTVGGALFVVSHGRGHLWYNSPGLQGGVGHCNHGVNSRYTVTGPESVVSLGNDIAGNPETVSDAGKAYGSGPDNEMALYAYDPDTFAAVTGGNVWSVPVRDWGYVLDRFPNFAVAKAVGAWSQIRPNGIAADQTSRLLMIPCGFATGGVLNGSGFYVNVFKVAA